MACSCDASPSGNGSRRRTSGPSLTTAVRPTDVRVSVRFSWPPHGCLARRDRLLNAIGATHRAPPLDHHKNLMAHRRMTTNVSTGCQVENSHACRVPEKGCDREPLTVESRFAEPRLAADFQDLHGERLMGNAADATPKATPANGGYCSSRYPVQPYRRPKSFVTSGFSFNGASDAPRE